MCECPTGSACEVPVSTFLPQTHCRQSGFVLFPHDSSVRNCFVVNIQVFYQCPGNIQFAETMRPKKLTPFTHRFVWQDGQAK